MKLNAGKFAKDASWVMGLVYIVCTVFVYLLPALSGQLMGWLAHVPGVAERRVLFGQFLGGLIQVLIYSYIGAWLFAWIFNRATRD